MVATFLQVLQIIAPVFILGGIGFIWVKAGWEYPAQFVTRVTMSMAIPCLVFMALVKSEIDPLELRDTALAAFVTYVLVGLILIVFLKIRSLDQRTFLAPLAFGNTGNLGLPLAFYAFGQVGFDFAVVVFAVMILLAFTAGVWMVSCGRSPLVAIKEPMVWAAVFGSLFLVMDWDVPDWAGNTFDLIGQMGIPLMLITLGVAVTRLKPAALNRTV